MHENNEISEEETIVTIQRKTMKIFRKEIFNIFSETFFNISQKQRYFLERGSADAYELNERYV